MNILKKAADVYYAEGDILVIATADLAFLKQQAALSPRRIARLCTHRDVADRLHEMTIVNLRETYIRPHKNTDKPKSFLVLEGAMDVVRFDDDGAVVGADRLGAPGSGWPHYYRLHRTRYHTLRTVSPSVVFQETTTGPFAPGDTVFAPWSPDGASPALCAAFVAKMDAAVANHLPPYQPPFANPA